MTTIHNQTKEIANVGEEITLSAARQFVANFHSASPNETAAFIVGRHIIEKILSQPGCVGLKICNAINEFNEKTLVYLGIDSNGKNLLESLEIGENGHIAVRPMIVADRLPPKTLGEGLDSLIVPENM
jgi:hypothetical protein